MLAEDSLSYTSQGSRVVVDLISEPREGLLAVSAQRLTAKNGAVPEPQGYVEPPSVLVI
jgi:hypothetical protein